MQIFLVRDNNQWEPHLPVITMAYNTKVYKATGVTPFRRKAKLPADLVPDTLYASVPANVQAIIKRYQAVFDAIQQKKEGMIRRSTATYEGTSGTLPPAWSPGSPGKSSRDGGAPGRCSAAPP